MPTGTIATGNGAQPSRSGAAKSTPADRALWRGWLIAFGLALTLYASTANRGIQWQDSGFRVLRVLNHDLLGHLGLALSHPLHYWLSRLVILPGWSNPAFAITLLSSLFAAATVANVFECVQFLTRSVKAAAFAAVSLAFAHIFWQMATLAESYTLTAALLSAEIWCLALFLRGHRWGLAGMFLCNGLGLANHMLASLTTPILVIVALLAWRERRINLRDLAIAAALWIFGSLPYTGLVALQCVRTGDFGGTIRSALFGTAYADRVLNVSLSPVLLARSAAFLIYDFPNLLLPAAILGLLKMRNTATPRRFGLALLAALIMHGLFVIRYNIVDQQTFFVPVCVLLSIWGGLGAAHVLSWSASKGRTALAIAAVTLAILTPAVYAVAPYAARKMHLLDKYTQKPYRDSYTYFFVPWSVVEDSADRIGEVAIGLAQPNGIIFYQDGMARPAMEYKRLIHNATGVHLLPLPSLKTSADQDRFLQSLKTLPANQKIVLVPTDVRHAPPEIPGLKWTPHDGLYLLQPASTQPNR